MEAVISQILLPRISGGRIVSTEVIIANNLIRKLILEAKANEIPVNMEGSKLEGMNVMEQALAELVKRNLVTEEDALLRSSNPIKLKKFLTY